MKCTFHPTQAATARCTCCQRRLCSACDHRIKGAPYCQECIVAGVETLRRSFTAEGERIVTDARGHSPLMAGLFALVPGLGAAYNGQNIKSLLHFITTVSLWQLGDIAAKPLKLTFVLGGVGFYLFSIYDAVRAARRKRAGEDLQTEDDALKKLLRENTPVWGALLVSVGLLTLLDLVFPFLLRPVWPFLLIVAGLFLLRGYQRHVQVDVAPSEFRAQPPSAIGAPYERAEGNLVSAESRFDKWR